MSSRLQILTLKFGTKYGPEYVNRLYSGLRRNSSCDFDFLCYTDDPSGIREEIKIRDLDPSCNTHWQKLEFHKKGFVEPGTRCLILDIDWVVVGSVDDILSFPIEEGTFVSATRWWSNRYNYCPINGGFQMFYNGETDHLWTKYNEKPEYWRNHYYDRGDVVTKGMGEQNFIWNNLELAVQCPEGSWFGRFSSDPGMQQCNQAMWRKRVDEHDPYFINDELNERIKMVHFTSDFDCYSNDNDIAAHKWIEEHWID